MVDQRVKKEATTAREIFCHCLAVGLTASAERRPLVCVVPR